MSITNYTCNGKCSCCGECCSDTLHLSEEEIQRIDNYMKDKNIQSSSYKEKYLDLSCPFRNEMLKICMIYEVRPDICRIFKCDKNPQEIVKNREFTNFNKKLRSLRLIFFDDDRNQKGLKKYKIKVYGRNTEKSDIGS